MQEHIITLFIMFLYTLYIICCYKEVIKQGMNREPYPPAYSTYMYVRRFDVIMHVSNAATS